jgi:hypothetical protein
MLYVVRLIAFPRLCSWLLRQRRSRSIARAWVLSVDLSPVGASTVRTVDVAR